MNKDEIILEFVSEMQKCAPDDYQEIKLVLLSCNSEKPAVVGFLKLAFELIESKRPKLIEMKGAKQL